MKGSGTTHAQTHNTKHLKDKEKKKLVEKERQQNNAKYTSFEQHKARKTIVLVNLQLIFTNKN